MFLKYDDDNSGYLDLDEIAQLLSDTAPVQRTGATTKEEDHTNDAISILHSLDNDRNGYVEKSEFVQWVVR
jgi:Ca2+-binding EF-hand superfamily protein